jgi:hypothetical protein
MEVEYDQEPFARPRYGYIVTEGRHEEQRGRIGFIPLHKGSLESEENLAIFFPGRDGQRECSQVQTLFSQYRTISCVRVWDFPESYCFATVHAQLALGSNGLISAGHGESVCHLTDDELPADELPVRLPTGRQRDITQPRDHFVS